MINNNNNNKINFLYFNLSDLINYDEDNYFAYSLDEYYTLDRFNGFFFNIRNITKSELENFLIFFGGDISMLYDRKFMINFSFFLSLFYNQALIVLLMLYINVIELYVIFSSIRFNMKRSIFYLVSIFNKRVLLEVYRFFISFCDKYKFINFGVFKNFILSTAYFFDSNVKLYHYYYFMDSELYGNDIFVRYYSNFFDNVFYERLSFLELVEHFIDLLIYNLYNLYYINNNLVFTKMLVCNTFNHMNFLGTKFIYNKYLNYINNFLNYFVFIHEIYVFFRLYLYIFYFLLKKKLNFCVLRKFIKFFTFQFDKLLKFYYTIKYIYIKDVISFAIFLFHEIRVFLYKCIFLTKKRVLFFCKFFYNFFFFFFKSFNSVKLFFFRELLYVDYNVIFLRYNLYLFTNLRKLNSINLFGLNCLFQYGLLNLNLYKFKESDFCKKLIKSPLFSFEFKLFNFLYYYKDSLELLNSYVFSKLNLVLFFYNIYTFRTFENYNFYKCKNVNKWSFFEFFKKYGNIMLLSFNFSLYDVVIKRFYNITQYIYIPLVFRIKAEMEDFFFLLVEEFFAEDFEYFLDDITLSDHSLIGLYDDMEDWMDFLDNFFEDVEPCDLLFFFLIEENLSINYYVYNTIVYKYSDIYPSIQPLNFNVSWEFDLEYSKVSPFFLKRIFLNGDDRIQNLINSDMWYNWINYILISDLYSFDYNYYNRTPEYRGLNLKKKKNRLFMYSNFGRRIKDLEFADVFEYIDYNFLVRYEDSGIYEKIYEYLNNDNIDLEIPNDFSNWSDENYLTEYSAFNNLLLLFSDIDIPEEGYPLEPIEETCIRDLAILNDVWLWWEYISKMSNSKILSKKIRPRTLDEALFFHMYVLSGLYVLMDSHLSDELNEYENEFLKKSMEYLEKLKKNGLYINSLNEFDIYYNKWLDKYDDMVFLNDYQDIIESMYIYSVHVNNDMEQFFFWKNKTFSDIKFDNLFLYSLRMEKEFFNFLMSSFKMCLLSFYSSSYKSKLFKFWEDFFLNIIEIAYSSLDIGRLNDLDAEVDYSSFWFNFERSLNPWYKFENHSVLEELAYSPDDDGMYISEKINSSLLDLADSNMLMVNGLDITASFAEIMFFDLYESYMEIYSDTDQDFHDSAFVSRLRFFEDEEILIRDHFDDYSEDGGYFLDYQYEECLDDQPFEYNVERLAFESMQYSNYFIGESYDYYLERFYSIHKLNFFLYGLFNSYLKRCSIFKNDVIFDNSFFFKKNKKMYSVVHYYFLMDKSQYKFELSLYYLICLFVRRLRGKIIFNYFVILLVFYYFVNWIRSCKFLSIKYKTLLLMLLVLYFNYCFLFFLYKKKLTLLSVRSLSLNVIYELIKYLLKKLYFFFKYFIYAYNYYIYRTFIIKKFKFLLVDLYKSYNYYSFYNIFFYSKNEQQKDILLKNMDMSVNIYNKFSSFRSYMSTYNIYIQTSFYNYNMINDKLLYNYFYGLITVNNYTNNTDKIVNSDLVKTSNLYDFFFFTEKARCYYEVSNNDVNFIDHMDVFKDASYDDYEDEDDDVEIFTDEWTFDFTIGDLAEDIEEDTYDDEITYNSEELDFELSLDPVFNLILSTEEDKHIDVYLDNDKWVWQYRFDFFFKKFYYSNLNYIRMFFIKLLGLYKLKVPVTSGFSLYDNFHYFYSDYMDYDDSNSEILIDRAEEYGENSTSKDADFYRKYSYISDFSVYRNFFDFQLSKNFNNCYNILIPKFIYTFEFIDVFDYFIDFNNVEISEFDEPYDIYNSIYGFSFSADKKFLDLFFYYELYKILFYIKYILLYIYIYVYIDSSQKKFVFISFFFFDLYIYLRKILTLLFYKNKNFLNYINLKYVFNKIYMFFYNSLYNNNKNNVILNSLGDFFPFYKFNYEVILKKIFILKTYYNNFLSMHSYLLLLKILDYIQNFSLDKKKFCLFFLKIKNLLHLYEMCIFYNAYRLALVYSQYGLTESYFFFEKLILTKTFNLKLKVIKLNYKIIYYNIFFFEFFWFIIVSVCLLIGLVQILPNIFFSGTLWIEGGGFYEKTDEALQRRIITWNWKIFDDRYKFMLNDTWTSLWGIF
jgi:hypothetical protein